MLVTEVVEQQNLSPDSNVGAFLFLRNRKGISHMGLGLNALVSFLLW